MNTPLSDTIAYVVTLVHGTFARRTTWIHNDSALCRHIREALGPSVTIAPFRWSGRNSISARLRGAEKLRAHLVELLRQHSGARHYIVGHSHGGSVVLYALRDDDSLRQRVNGIVCLSTPFIYARTRDLGLGAFGKISFGLATFSFTSWVVWLSMLGTRRLLSAAVPLCATPSEIDGIVSLVLGLVLAALVWVAFRKVQRRVARAKARIDLSGLRDVPLLIVRSPADEASAALAAFQFAAWLIDRAWAGIRMVERRKRALGWVLLALAALWVWLQAAMMKGTGTHLPAGILVGPTAWRIELILGPLARGPVLGLFAVLFVWWTGVLFTLIVVCIGVPSIIVLLAVMLLPFGFDIALSAPFLKLSVESTPPGQWAIAQLPLGQLHGRESSTTAIGLMHSATYEDEGALTLITGWMKSGP